MAICPICKLEYEEGITQCADCKCDLVDTLPEFDITIPIYYDENEDYISRLIEYLKYSGINAVQQQYDEQQKSYCIYTNMTEEKNVKRLLNIYFENELKEELQNQPEQEVYQKLQAEAAPGNYVKKADRYADLRSSGLSLIVIGILGDIYLIGKTIGLIPFGPDYEGVTGILFLLVMGTLFNVFLVGGILAYKSSISIREGISSEEQLTTSILSEFSSKNAKELDTYYETNVDDGTLYFNRTDYLKRQITEKYGSLDEAYLEDLVEQIYQAVFEA